MVRRKGWSSRSGIIRIYPPTGWRDWPLYNQRQSQSYNLSELDNKDILSLNSPNDGTFYQIHRDSLWWRPLPQKFPRSLLSESNDPHQSNCTRAGHNYQDLRSCMKRILSELGKFCFYKLLSLWGLRRNRRIGRKVGRAAIGFLWHDEEHDYVQEHK